VLELKVLELKALKLKVLEQKLYVHYSAASNGLKGQDSVFENIWYITNNV
jgi:hypothetical protein